MKNLAYIILISSFLFILAGCAGNAESQSTMDELHDDEASDVNVEEYDDGSIQQAEDIVVEKYEGEPYAFTP